MTIATTNIDTHLPCHACDYDLHTLASDGFCPECGVSIDETIRQPATQFEVRLPHVAIGCVIVGSCLLIVINFLVIHSYLPMVDVFAYVWAIVGMASMLASIVFARKKQYEIAVATGIVMMLSMPAVMFNLFVFVGLMGV